MAVGPQIESMGHDLYDGGRSPMTMAGIPSEAPQKRAASPSRAVRVVMTLSFYPRGGSAQVARYLARVLNADGFSTTVCCGTLGPPGSASHAATFFEGLDLEVVDFNEAFRHFELGLDPMAVAVPMQPSFEDRPGVPDRVLASLDSEDSQRQIDAWSDALRRCGQPDVYHVNHLSHVNDAIRTLADTPVVVQLHGTELKMLETIRSGAPSSWTYADQWDRRLVSAAHHANRLVVNSASVRDLASELLEVDPESIAIIPNGVDLDRFCPGAVDSGDRMAAWRQWLVADPLGWDESGRPGSIRYTDADLERHFRHPATGDPLPVLLFAGRFLGFKRVPLLIEAYAKARAALGPEAPPLVIWGGYPGEWEGEHPASVANSLGVEGVFFSGWRGHDDLSAALRCADLFVAPSVDEPFGQVYLEAMATELPVIATNTGGPPSFINTDPSRPNGWLVAPDSVDDLAKAIEEGVRQPADRQRRGQYGRQLIERDYDWRSIGQKYEAIYLAVTANTRSSGPD